MLLDWWPKQWMSLRNLMTSRGNSHRTSTGSLGRARRAGRDSRGGMGVDISTAVPGVVAAAVIVDSPSVTPSTAMRPAAARVTVVFDSKRSPRGKEREQIVSGLNVVYAAGEKSADDWIEIAIEQSREPRKLVVISNDARVQEAARRRGAQAWTDQDLLADLDTDTRKQRPEPEQQPDDRPGPDSAEEIQHWVDEFSSIVDDPELRKFLDQDRFE